MNEIIFAGCVPTTLGGYFKGLGAVRILAEQADSNARCCWRAGCLSVISQLTSAEVSKFFLERYRPTPIISPWNGRAGFLEGASGADSTRKGAIILSRILASAGDRFSRYRAVLSCIQGIRTIESLNAIRNEVKALEEKKSKRHAYDEGRLKEVKQEEKRLKGYLLTDLRGSLPDDFLPWLDACLVLTHGSMIPGPLLGSGGNEGSMDFSVNHLILLAELIDPETDAPTETAISSLDGSLFDTTCSTSTRGHPGFLNPSAVGGVNMGIGFDEEGGENPWNTVLMLEGSLLLATSATKRPDSGVSAALSFPFMTNSLRAGSGSVAADESARPEFWAPLWSNPASMVEVRSLMVEGKGVVGRRQARNGLDMMRAIATLGVSRGLSSFERFGLFERRGQGYYVASNLGHVTVRDKAEKDWTSDLEYRNWLDLFRGFARGNNTARRFLSLCRRLEDALFDAAGHPLKPAEVQATLVLLGEIEAALASSKDARESVPPVPLLSDAWVHAADDGTAAFRIARALSGLQGTGEVRVPLRAQLFPIHPQSNAWMTPEYKAKHASDPVCRIRLHAEAKGKLPDTLIELLSHRLEVAERLDARDALGGPDKLLRSSSDIDLDDLLAFLQTAHMDVHIARLLPGLSLCRVPSDAERAAGQGAVPAAFAILKLCVSPDATLRDLRLLRPDRHVPVPAGMLAQLASANSRRAVQMAWRRLRASGLWPLFGVNALPELEPIDSRRAAAALLIPLRFGAVGALGHSVLTVPEAESDEEY